jgi:hypothetical protein
MHQRSSFLDPDPDQDPDLDQGTGPDPDKDQDLDQVPDKDMDMDPDKDQDPDLVPDQDQDPDPDLDPDPDRDPDRDQNARLCIRRFPERLNGRQLYVVVPREPLEIRGWSGQRSGAVDDPCLGQEQASVVHPLKLAAVDVAAAVDVDSLSQ